MVLLFGIPPFASTAQTPTPADVRRQEAYAFEQRGDTAKAQVAWLAVLKAYPRDAEANAHLGLLHARLEQYNEAVSFYRAALAADPNMPGLKLNLGLALFKGGKLKEAAEVFSSLLNSVPSDSPESLRLETLIGLSDYGAGAYAAAVPFLRRATAADSQNLPFRLALAHSCLRSAQYQCVLDVYKEILTLNSESAEADMLAGEALDEMKDRTAAIEQFRAAVKADPKMPEAHFALGYLLWCQLQFEEAATEFQAELAMNPMHVQALTYLGDSEMNLSQPEVAISALQQAASLDPANWLAHLDLGTLYIDKGRKEDALRELTLAEQLNPNEQNVHFRLGRFYKSIGKTAEASAEFEKTRNLQKASDESVLKKLHPTSDTSRDATKAAGLPLN